MLHEERATTNAFPAFSTWIRARSNFEAKELHKAPPRHSVLTACKNSQFDKGARQNFGMNYAKNFLVNLGNGFGHSPAKYLGKMVSAVKTTGVRGDTDFSSQGMSGEKPDTQTPYHDRREDKKQACEFSDTMNEEEIGMIG
jgi:hypothetical protein